MSGISIECRSAAGVRIERQLIGASDTSYLSRGERAGVDPALLVQVSAAEAGEPEIWLSNDSEDQRLDIYSMHDGRTTRQRPLAPQRGRAMSMAAADRVFLIPLAITAQTRSQRR